MFGSAILNKYTKKLNKKLYEDGSIELLLYE